MLLGVLKLDRKEIQRAYVKKRSTFLIKFPAEEKNPSDLRMDELVSLIKKPAKEHP
jgi:hypothetical protein